MNVKNFRQYFEQRGYSIVGNTACGVENGIPVSVQWVTATVWRVDFAVDPSRWKEFKNDWNTRLGKLGKSGSSGNLFFVNMTVKNSTYDADYRQVVQISTDVFRANNAPLLDQCAFCGRQGCDTLVYHEQRYVPVHNACCEQAVGGAVEKARKNDQEGNYLLGILGGILGAAVGIIPSVLTIFFAEKIYSVLFALIPICIYFGYKLFKGKLSKASLAITIVLTIASVFLLEIVMLVIIFSTELQVPVGNVIGVLPDLLAAGEIWEAMASDLVMELVFAGLGIWIAWGYISRTNGSQLAGVQAQMATRRPIAPAAAPAASAPAAAPVPPQGSQGE